ncbi:MAG: hypothetical protein ACU837_12725 [Gammaproteobacteria bacterium]
MPMRKAALLVSALLAGLLPAYAGEPLAVVTMPSTPIDTLSFEDLKLIYLRKTLLDKTGKRWIPLNMPPNDELRRAFSLTLFAKLPEDQEEYWNDQYFQGITPPEVMASEEAILRFVSLTPGAIGYVRKYKADKRVKVLIVVPAQPID